MARGWRVNETLRIDNVTAARAARAILSLPSKSRLVELQPA